MSNRIVDFLIGDLSKSAAEEIEKRFPNLETNLRKLLEVGKNGKRSKYRKGRGYLELSDRVKKMERPKVLPPVLAFMGSVMYDFFVNSYKDKTNEMYWGRIAKSEKELTELGEKLKIMEDKISEILVNKGEVKKGEGERSFVLVQVNPGTFVLVPVDPIIVPEEVAGGDVADGEVAGGVADDVADGEVAGGVGVDVAVVPPSVPKGKKSRNVAYVGAALVVAGLVGAFIYYLKRD